MRARSEVLVGAVILLGGLIVAGGTFWLRGGELGSEDLVLRARFLQVGQLSEGNPVRLRGVQIGRVERVELESGGDGVIARLRIDGDVALPAEPVVLASPQSLFGDWQVEILARSRFPSYDYAATMDPAILPGYALPDVSQITAVADRIAENLAVLSDRVEIAFTEETAHNVRRAIENIQAVSAELTRLVAGQQQAVEELTTQLGTTSRALGEAAEYARRAFAQVDRAVAEGELEAIVDNAHRASAQADSLSAQLLDTSRRLRRMSTSAERAFGRVDSLAERIDGGEGTLGRLVADTALYDELVRTNTALQALLRDIEENPGRYFHFSIF
ncbi:MAG: MlaD family protein [Gemmatimonadota bacterium]